MVSEMDDNVSVKITGLDDLKQVLSEIPKQLRKKFLLQALRKAARVPLQEGRKEVPVMSSQDAMKAPFRTPGLVRKKLSVRLSKESRKAGNVGVFINVRPAKAGLRGAKSKQDPFYWKFVNFGTKKMPKRDFMSKAADALPMALEVFKAEIAPVIQWWNNRK